jgi:hypothetical protein
MKERRNEDRRIDGFLYFDYGGGWRFAGFWALQ